MYRAEMPEITYAVAGTVWNASVIPALKSYNTYTTWCRLKSKVVAWVPPTHPSSLITSTQTKFPLSLYLRTSLLARNGRKTMWLSWRDLLIEHPPLTLIRRANVLTAYGSHDPRPPTISSLPAPMLDDLSYEWLHFLTHARQNVHLMTQAGESKPSTSFNA